MPFYDLICMFSKLKFGPSLCHAFRKRQDQFFCFRGFNLFNCHLLPYGDPGILPDEIINAHNSLFPVLPVRSPYLCSGLFLPPYLHNVTGRELKFQQSCRVKPDNSSSKVNRICLFNLQLYFFHGSSRK
ncbi:hypothetical protein DSECCO2_423730 [anaerobic digester metagenome]